MKRVVISVIVFATVLISIGQVQAKSPHLGKIFVSSGGDFTLALLG